MDVITQALLMGSAGGGAARDPYFQNTTLLLHGDGTNGAQNNTFVDGSSNNFTITRNGNTTQGSFSPYGDNWSNYFDGNGDYLNTGTSSNLALANNVDWTIEGFVYVTSFAAANCFVFSSNGVSNTFATSHNFGIYITTFGYLTFEYSQSASTILSVTGTVAVSLNTWTHIALVYNGTAKTLTTYVNGVRDLNASSISAYAPPASSPRITIGRTDSIVITPTYFFNGYISNLRIVKGTAVYTSNFTPSTTPLTAITNTSLLTCQSNSFQDNSTNAFAITRNGDVSVQRFSPFAPSAAYSATSFDDAASQYFDGSGDYLTVPAGNVVNFSAGEAFTFEFWVYTTTAATQSITQGGANTFSLNLVASGNLQYGKSGVTNIIDAGPIQYGVWNHVLIARDTSNRSRMWVNGISVGSSTTDTYAFNSATQYFGLNPNSTSPFTGYLSNLRVVKGTALYDPTSSAAITLPTTPLTAVTNTSLLTCQNYTVRDNSTNNFAITVNGNTRGDRLVPFGNNWSNFFDGNGDYFTVAYNSVFNLAGNTFTVEAWIYLTGNASADLDGSNVATIAAYGGASVNTGWAFHVIQSGTNQIAFQTNGSGANYTACNVTLAKNRWYHVAFVRNGSTNAIYLDGASQTLSTNTYAGVSTTNQTLKIGAERIFTSYNHDFPGYISNFRIVNGTAVYTSNFTPPTSPLTAITNTSLLTCQSNRFIDNSTNAFTITRNGDVTVENENPFPAPVPTLTSAIGGSAYFDGTGDYLSVADNAALELGSSNFTVEAWIYLTGGSGTQRAIITKRSAAANFGGYSLYLETSNALGFVADDNTSTPWAVSILGTTVTLGQWTHVAITRSGSTWTLWKNGVSDGTATSSITINDAATNLSIGAVAAGETLIVGYISDARVVNGTALYTAAFTPPTAPLTAVTNTSLLCNFTNAGIYDNAMMNDLETVGNAQISTTQKKYGTGALYFDGTGDYLKGASSNLLVMSTGDFTIEFWVYIAARTSFGYVYASGAQANDIFVSFDTNGNFLRLTNSSTVFAVTSTLSLTTWTHIAVVRSSGSSKIYVDGIGGTAVACTIDFTATGPSVGASNVGNSPFNGYIDDLRITKGVARYTANFTPPTAALPDY